MLLKGEMTLLKKIICSFILFTFASTSVFAQTASQVTSYLNSSQGKAFLQSSDGQNLVNQLKGQQTTQAGGQTSQNQAAQGQTEIDNLQYLTSEEAFSLKVKKMSDIERFFSQDLVAQKQEPLIQYGYKFFKPDQTNSDQGKNTLSFLPTQNQGSPVSPNYIIGPGDSFKITLWGITEGIFDVEVNSEGDIVLPKIGIVEVAGLSYGDLKQFLEEKLGRYYESVNVGVTMGKLRGVKIYVAGEVDKPGSYNLTSLSSVFDALLAAGGPTKKGSMRKIQLVRGNRNIADIDLYSFFISGRQANSPQLQEGDTIFVPVIGDVVAINGAIPRPAIYEIKGRADLADLIALAGGLLPTSYLSRVQVVRIEAHERKVARDENINLSRSRQKLNFTLASLDFVEIFPIYQSIDNRVFLEGSVKYPGAYELQDDMRIKDLLSSKELFATGAYLPRVEIIRIEENSFKTRILAVDIDRLFSGDSSQNIALQSNDRVVVSSINKEQARVTIKGEVMRSGEYSVAPGEKLSSVLKRAGGYTPNAYLFGAKFIRKSVKDFQESRNKQLISKLEEELIVKARENATSIKGGQTEASATAQLETAKKMLDLIKERMPEGRIVISLNTIEKFENSEGDIELEDGDELIIPAVSHIVLVMGEVFNPNSFVYSEKYKLNDYLKRVGGITKNGDQGEMFIIRADGSVLSKRQTSIYSVKLMPGDAIIVPQVIDTFNFWATITDFTRWLYEAVVTFSLIQSLIK